MYLKKFNFNNNDFKSIIESKHLKFTIKNLILVVKIIGKCDYSYPVK